jgi:uncharacterized protein (TIGR00369 family)
VTENMRSAVIQWQQPTETFSELTHLSGLDYLAAVMDGQIPLAPCAQVLGITIESAQRGAVELSMPFIDYHTNYLGFLSGGIVAALLDAALGCAVVSVLGADQEMMTLDLSVDYVRAISPSNSRLLATGRVVHSGRNRGLATGEVTDEQGRVYAIAKSACFIRPRSS